MLANSTRQRKASTVAGGGSDLMVHTLMKAVLTSIVMARLTRIFRKIHMAVYDLLYGSTALNKTVAVMFTLLLFHQITATKALDKSVVAFFPFQLYNNHIIRRR